MIEGVVVKSCVVHSDDRGSLIEIVRSCERLFQALIVAKTFMQILDLRSQIADFIDGLMQLRDAIVYLRR